MIKNFALFNTGLVTQRGVGWRWDLATPEEEDLAIDVLNGYKSVSPSIRHMRRLETLPQPTGKPVSILVPLIAMSVFCVCAVEAGALFGVVSILGAAAGWTLGKVTNGDFA